MAVLGVPVVQEGRVGRNRQQGRQQLPHPIRDRDRTVRAPHPDVDVEAPGVVALRDPAKVALEAAVVLGVDDVLIQVIGPGMGPGRRRGPAPVRPRSRTAARGDPLPIGGVAEGLALPGADLDLVDQLALDRQGEQLVAQAGRIHLLEPVLEVEDRRVEDRELLLDPDREVG